MRHNPAVDLAPFGRWTLRDKAAPFCFLLDSVRAEPVEALDL